MQIVALPLIASLLAIGPGADAPLVSQPSFDRVYGGQAAAACQWPQSIAFNNCSGTLVHPQMVLYAGHCGTNKTNVRFGTSTGNPARTVAVDYCEKHPNANGQVSTWDFAFCRLAQPVTDVDPTPPAMGCELDTLDVGDDVAIVGFGQTNNGPFGTKHWAMTPLMSEPYEQGNFGLLLIGDDGKTICFGDSGGSTYMLHPDGGWRALAITSGIQGNCGTGQGVHILMDWTIPWVEQESGMDISPCFDQDSEWDPGPGCTGFATAPDANNGNWNGGCSVGAVTGTIESCGPGYNAPPDNDGPNVVITSPLDGAVLDPGFTDIDIDADDGEGYAVVKVWMRVDGMDLPNEDTLEPWGFPMVNFPKGVFELQAVGEDWFGNVGESEIVTIYVGEDPPGDESEDGGDTEESGDGGGTTEEDTGSDDEQDDGATETDDDGSTGGASGDDGGEPSGCGCSTDSTAPGCALLLVLAAVRRRARPGQLRPH
jgi:hypothetical protein